MKGCGALTPIKQILETILDPSRTHKCREKEKPTYKRKWAENKRKKKKEERKRKSNLNLKGKKSTSVLKEMSLEMFNFPYDQVGKLLRCALEDSVNNFKPKNYSMLTIKTYHWGMHFLLAPSACPLYEQENRDTPDMFTGPALLFVWWTESWKLYCQHCLLEKPGTN